MALNERFYGVLLATAIRPHWQGKFTAWGLGCRLLGTYRHLDTDHPLQCFL